MHCSETTNTEAGVVKNLVGMIPHSFSAYGRGSLRGRLLRGGMGSALIHAGSHVLALATGIILARALGAVGYGVYAYAMALMAALMVVSQLGMPPLLVREVAASEVRGDWAHLRGIIVRAGQVVFVASVVTTVSTACILWLWAGDMAANEWLTILVMLLLLPFAAVMTVATWALRGLRHVVKSLSIEMLVRPALVLFLVSVLFVVDQSILLPHYVMALQIPAAIFSLCVALYLLFKHLPEPVRSAHSAYHTREWLGSVLPFTLLAGAGILNSQVDILMLGLFRPNQDVGIYRVAVQGAGLVAFGLQVANAVIAPQFARMYALGDTARLQQLVTASARVTLLIALPIALAFMIAGGDIAAWVFGQEFLRAHIPLALLAVGQLVNAAMGSVGFLLNMTGHEKITTRIMFMTAILNVILNLVLIPPFGMAGAAAATAFSLALWNVLLYRAVKARLGIRSTAF